MRFIRRKWVGEFSQNEKVLFEKKIQNTQYFRETNASIASSLVRSKSYVTDSHWVFWSAIRSSDRNSSSGTGNNTIIQKYSSLPRRSFNRLFGWYRLVLDTPVVYFMLNIGASIVSAWMYVYRTHNRIANKYE